MLWAYLYFLGCPYCHGKGYPGTARSKAEFVAWNNCWKNASYVQASILYGIICSDEQRFFCCKWYCFTSAKGGVLWFSHQEALSLAK